MWLQPLLSDWYFHYKISIYVIHVVEYISVCFVFIFTYQIIFKLIDVFCISIPHRRGPYSF